MKALYCNICAKVLHGYSGMDLVRMDIVVGIGLTPHALYKGMIAIMTINC